MHIPPRIIYKNSALHQQFKEFINKTAADCDVLKTKSSFLLSKDKNMKFIFQ